jgi:hypothetical protein
MAFGVVRNQSLWKHAETPLSVERHERKKAKQKAMEEAYAEAEKRDKRRCRVTGVRLVVGAVEARGRLEHHHLVKRSRSRHLREDVRNIVCVSAFVHDLITRGWIVSEGRDANKFIAWHWTELATSTPVVIKRQNPSARDSR